MADSDVDDDDDFVPSRAYLTHQKRKATTKSIRLNKTDSRARKGKLPPPKKQKFTPSSPSPVVALPSSPGALWSHQSHNDRRAIKASTVAKKTGDVIVLDEFDDEDAEVSNVDLPTQEGESHCSISAPTHPINCALDERPVQGSSGAGSNPPQPSASTGSRKLDKGEAFHEGRQSLSSCRQRSPSACNGVSTTTAFGGRTLEASTGESGCNEHCTALETLGCGVVHLNGSSEATTCNDCGDNDCASDDDWDPELDALLLKVDDTEGLERSSSAPLVRPPLIQNVATPSIHSSVHGPRRNVTQGSSPASTGTLSNSPKQSNASSKQTSLLYYFKGHSEQRFISHCLRSSMSSFPKRPKHFFPRSSTTAHPTHKATSAPTSSMPLPPIQVQYEPDVTAPSKGHCPFYKRVQGTTFTVDAFSYGAIPGCTAYFLSHFHSDHYRGLSSRFSGPIFCSKPTGNLVVQELKVSSTHIHTLSLDQAHIVQGVTVTLLEANHCPGAVMFLFQLPCGSNILHTGDFRAHSSMFASPPLQSLPSLKTLYLDTTYCDSQYSFPLQEEVVSFIVNRVIAEKKTKKRLMVVCGTYTIGKERIFLGIARALGCKAGVERRKKAVLDCLEDKAVSSLLTTDLSSTCLHVQPMAKLTAKSLQSYLDQYSRQYDALLAVRPTGWTFGGSRKDWRVPQQHGRISIYGVPYSEHSSVDELEMFVRQLKPQRIIPTVGVGSEANRRSMSNLIAQWTGRQTQSRT